MDDLVNASKCGCRRPLNGIHNENANGLDVYAKIGGCTKSGMWKSGSWANFEPICRRFLCEIRNIYIQIRINLPFRRSVVISPEHLRAIPIVFATRGSRWRPIMRLRCRRCRHWRLGHCCRAHLCCSHLCRCYDNDSHGDTTDNVRRIHSNFGCHCCCRRRRSQLVAYLPPNSIVSFERRVALNWYWVR